MKSILKKLCPNIYKFIHTIYANTFYLLFRGYFADYFKYIILHKKNDFRALFELGFEKIKTYKTTYWRFQTNNKTYYRRYFLAIYCGKQCFIKVAKNDKTLENEIYIRNRIKDYKYTPTTRLSIDNFIEGSQLLAIDYRKDVHRIDFQNVRTSFNKICSDFIKILDWLEENKIVHGDIHIDNLMQDQEGDLVLFDFGISRFQGEENNIDYIKWPGTYYKKTGKYRIYDDVYSYKMMFEEYFSGEINYEDEIYRLICLREGKNIFQVEEHEK